jgi:AraC-like DNA-binding protein
MMEPSPNRHLTILANMIIIFQKISMVYANLENTQEPAFTLEQELVHYINQNLEQELSIEALCKQFYLSRAQLCRFFKTTIGTSVGKYITAKRMVKAQNLILRGYKPTEVFPQCGYQNYSSFFRAYCKFFGYSPKEDIRNGVAGVPSSIIIG